VLDQVPLQALSMSDVSLLRSSSIVGGSEPDPGDAHGTIEGGFTSPRHVAAGVVELPGAVSEPSPVRTLVGSRSSRKSTLAKEDLYIPAQRKAEVMKWRLSVVQEDDLA